ncbi:Regulator of G-protein signaling 14 [Rhizophlyctis rosea]|uniref:Regulator of G-protein signaling 14 n=1 Tax=Rhizophlyctis rosea TaxID=64517 RepID=A0AAD5SGR1_9FUNG|nr:Regulator of G-protein signaling 14 [Rhizophlyctis rosea]
MLDLDTAAPPPSPDRILRVARVIKKSEKRASVHVSQFYRVNVSVPGGEIFRVTVDRDRTVDYLAKQIEAEYAFKYLLDEGIKKEGNGKKKRPLSITQVYDSGMLALKFEEKVGECLAFDDTVFVIDTSDDTENKRSSQILTTFGDDIPTGSLTENGTASYLENLPTPAADVPTEPQPIPSTPPPSVSFGAITEVPAEQPAPMRPRNYSLIPNPTLDDRLQATLHNKMSMRFFIDFCISEYTIENILFWLDVEIFQTCPLSLKAAYARYIYLIYVAVEAPLQVNLSSEVRKDVPWPLPADMRGDEVDVTMFDESQQQAYAMMKGHSFVRYEKSTVYNAYVEARRSDRPKYTANRIAGAYAQYFEIDTERLTSLSNLLSDPKSPQSESFLRSLSEGAKLEVDSALFRESLLTMIISQKFPKHLAAVVEGYFSDSNRVSWAQKQRKMQKEKKLSKFFGARVTPEQIQRQVMTSPRVSVTDFESLLGSSELLGVKKILSESEEEGDTSQVFGDDDGSNANQRRKKKEKLETFFGDKLPSQHKKVQQIVVPTFIDTASLEIEEPVVEATKPAVESSTSSLDDGEVLETNNDLGAEERRILQRRVKKIAAQLGEALDERTVSQAVTNKARGAVGSAIPRGPSLGSQDLMKAEDEEGALNRKNAIRHSKIFTAAELDRVRGSIGEGGTLPRTFSDSSLASHATQSTIDEPDVDSRLSHKRRLDKLSHMMGERINRDHLDQAAAGGRAPTNAQRRPLTAEERKAFQKKAAKLERMLGQVPATEDLIAAPPPVVRARRSIASLRAMVGQTKDVVDLIEKLTSLTEEGPPGASSQAARPSNRESILTPDSASDTSSSISSIDTQTKESRLRRLNKLRKFFGDQISVTQILEQQLLVDLEREIEEDVEDQNELYALKTEVEVIRMALKERDRELSTELSQSQELREEEGGGEGTPQPVRSRVPSSKSYATSSGGAYSVELPQLDFGDMSLGRGFIDNGKAKLPRGAATKETFESAGGTAVVGGGVKGTKTET